ncbi:MAG: hypothetical protein JNM21_01030 [Taibaiella sp.]|nr:hypothetical protein [Taibaiella sp.]
MKKVRVISTAAMFALLSVGSMTFMSCDKTEDCVLGYEGKDCDVEIRKEMLGTYNATDVNDADATDVYTYQPTVASGASVAIVNVSKFGDFFTNTEIVTANVTKSNDVISFTIPTQKPDNVNTVAGSGSYNVSTKKLTVSYSLTNVAGQVVNYTGNWTKQ